LNGPEGSGRGGVGLFMLLERVQAVALEDLLGFVREQHRVTVERDAELVRMRLA
jgi:hypothetical protein